MTCGSNFAYKVEWVHWPVGASLLDARVIAFSSDPQMNEGRYGLTKVGIGGWMLSLDTVESSDAGTYECNMMLLLNHTRRVEIKMFAQLVITGNTCLILYSQDLRVFESNFCKNCAHLMLVFSLI